MTLHRACTPGQRSSGFDRRIVVPQPLGKALKHPQRTLCSALRPGIELRPLALADQLDKVFRQEDSVRQSPGWARNWVSCWDSTAVRWSPRRITSHAARRAVSGGCLGR